MMIFVNHMLTQDTYNPEVLNKFLIILNPFAPHLTEELNEMMFKDDYAPLSDREWPQFDEELIVSESITIAVQINGKTRGTIDVSVNSQKEDIYNMILDNDKFSKYLDNMNIIKKIYVPSRLVNFVIN